MQVTIGNLTAVPGNAIVFEPVDKIPQESKNNLVEIVVSAVVSAVVVIALVLISVVLYRRHRSRLYTDNLYESYIVRVNGWLFLFWFQPSCLKILF